MVQGPSASVAQRTVEGHGFLKAKGIVFGIVVFSRNDTASFAGSSNQDHIVMTAHPVNHFAFEIAKAAVNCALREFAESGFWICMDPAILKTSKVSSTFLQVQHLMSGEVVAETGDVFIKAQKQVGSHGTHLPTLVLLHGSPMQNVMPQ